MAEFLRLLLNVVLKALIYLLSYLSVDHRDANVLQEIWKDLACQRSYLNIEGLVMATQLHIPQIKTPPNLRKSNFLFKTENWREGARGVLERWAILKNCLERWALAAKWVGALSTDFFRFFLLLEFTKFSRSMKKRALMEALSAERRLGRSAER